MAISRSLMNRQLRANGGIMDVTPRENFGLGSSLKKFVRKIIPNEVADIAVKAAPFVAPFNPALAGIMSGVGTFDQTGSISSGLKSGAMNYGGGQLARYAGGAGFQGNPFGQGGAFTQGGFQGGFSSPLGNQTGLGKLFSNQGTDPVQSINSGRGGDSASALSRSTANVPGGAETITDAVINKNTVVKEPGFLKNMFDGIKDQDYRKVAQTIGDGAKKFGKAMFTKPNPIPGGKPLIDKAAVMGAIAFTGSYIEAKALADDAGVELTEEAYDEARKTEKQEEYAGYLTNFFGGKKDGGRIGFKDGANKSIEEKIAELEFLTNKLMTEEGIQDRGYASKLASDIIGMKNESIDPNRLKFLNNESALSALPKDIRPEDEYYDTLKALENRADGGRIGYENGANEFMSEQMMLESNPGAAESGSPITIDTTMTGLINKYNTYKKSAPGVSEETRIFLKNDLLKSLEDAGISQEEFMMRLSEDTEMKANGGRIGFKKGSDPVYEMYLEDLEAGTIPSDKSYNEYLDDIEEDPDYDYSYAKGGRVTRKLGSPEEGERSGVMEMLAVDVDAGGDEEENMMMAYKPGSFYKKDFKPMEVDAINERLQSFLDGEGGGLPLPLIGTVKGIANTLKAGKAVFTGPEKTTIIRNLAGRSRGTSAYKELGKSIPEAKRIMDNPIDYLKDAAIFKELLKGIFKKDGGRIGYAFGTPENKAEGRDKTVMEMGVEDTIIENPKPELPNMEVAGDILPYEKIKLWEIIGKDIYDDWSSFSEIYDKYGADRMWKGVSGRPGKKDGGRIGLKDGTGSSNRVAQLMQERDWLLSKDEDVSFIDLELERDFGIQMKAEGGIMEARVPTGQPRLNQGGVAERDYRETGGFVPVGIKERADDVPAMLSKNEFVMTADSVRGLGNGSVEEGSKKLYNTMKQAEQKGKIA
jgi:hypothetical protein